MKNFSTSETRVLLSCLASNRTSLQIASEVADLRVSWDRLFDLAGQLGVGPLLYFRLGALGIRDVIPAEAIRQRKEECFSSQAWNMKVYAELRKVLVALSHEGLPVVVLKGAALAELAYPQIGLRTMADVDLLVEKKNLDKAGAILERLGFLPNEAYREKQWYRAHHHHIVPYVSPDGSLTIEIHWHIIERTALLDMPVDELWRRAQSVRIASVPCLALAPEHMLLHVALHLSSSNQFLSQLRGLYDVAELLRRWGGGLDWDEVLRVGALAGAKKHLYVVLSLVRDALGASVPADVLDQLRRESKWLPLEERMLKQIGLKAACIVDVGEHPLYEFVLRDLAENLLARETHSAAFLDVMRKLFRRGWAAYMRRYGYLVRRLAFRL